MSTGPPEHEVEGVPQLTPRRIRRRADGTWEQRVKAYNDLNTWEKIQPEEKLEGPWRVAAKFLLVVLALFAAFVLFQEVTREVDDAQAPGNGVEAPPAPPRP